MMKNKVMIMVMMDDSDDDKDTHDRCCKISLLNRTLNGNKRLVVFTMIFVHQRHPCNLSSINM